MHQISYVSCCCILVQIIHSWAAWQSRERRFLVWCNLHSPHVATKDLLHLGSSFFLRDQTQTCANVYYTCEQKGQRWEIVGKNSFPVVENVCVNYLRYVTDYSKAFAKSSVIWMRLCTLWFPMASLAVSSMPRTWVTNRKECALWFRVPKHTITHSE